MDESVGFLACFGLLSAFLSSVGLACFGAEPSSFNKSNGFDTPTPYEAILQKERKSEPKPTHKQTTHDRISANSPLPEIEQFRDIIKGSKVDARCLASHAACRVVERKQRRNGSALPPRSIAPRSNYQSPRYHPIHRHGLIDRSIDPSLPSLTADKSLAPHAIRRPNRRSSPRSLRVIHPIHRRCNLSS